MTRLRSLMMLWAVLAAASDARAQAVYTPDQPKREVAVTLGLYRIDDGGGFIGGRYSHAFNSIVALEVSGDHQGAGVNPGDRENTLFTVAARVSTPSPVYQPRAYITLGLARATAFDWRHSPMVGLGVQSPWDHLGLLAFRIEYQRFFSGDRRYYDRARLVLSGVVGFGKQR